MIKAFGKNGGNSDVFIKVVNNIGGDGGVIIQCVDSKGKALPFGNMVVITENGMHRCPSFNKDGNIPIKTDGRKKISELNNIGVIKESKV